MFSNINKKSATVIVVGLVFFIIGMSIGATMQFDFMRDHNMSIIDFGFFSANGYDLFTGVMNYAPIRTVVSISSVLIGFLMIVVTLFRNR